MTALTVETVEITRKGLLADAAWSRKRGEDHWADDRINALCDLALAALSERGGDAHLRSLISNDAYAITFQSIGQYRSWLLKNLSDERCEAGECQITEARGAQYRCEGKCAYAGEQNAAQEQPLATTTGTNPKGNPVNGTDKPGEKGITAPAAAPSEYPQTEAEYHAEAAERYADSDYGNNIDIQTTTAAPSEFVRVPREPTQEFWDIAWAHIKSNGHITGSASIMQIKRMLDACHAAMLAAAPPCPDAPAEARELAEELKPIFNELEKAVKKFPTWPTDPLHAVSVLGEEYGELVKEVLQMTYEPYKSNLLDVEVEARQTAAMAIRFYLSLQKYIYKQQDQHEQSALRGARHGCTG